MPVFSGHTCMHERCSLAIFDKSKISHAQKCIAFTSLSSVSLINVKYAASPDPHLSFSDIIPNIGIKVYRPGRKKVQMFDFTSVLFSQLYDRFFLLIFPYTTPGSRQSRLPLCKGSHFHCNNPNFRLPLLCTSDSAGHPMLPGQCIGYWREYRFP